MGFNSRFVSENTIKEYLEEKKQLKKLFSSDAFIFMDEVSSKVFDLHRNGVQDKEIEKILKQEI
jgi:hypothetical protein